MPILTPSALPIHPANAFALIYWATRACCCLALLACLGCMGTGQQIVGEHVINARELSLEGADALAQGDCERACWLFRESIKSHPEDQRTHARLAEALWEKGAEADQRLAIDHQRQAVELSDGQTTHVVRLGQMEYARGNLADARQLAERAITLNRRSAGAWALLADVEKEQGETQQALAHYQRSLAIQPHALEVQLAMAEVYQRQRQHTRCLATLRRAASQYAVTEVPRDVLLKTAVALANLERRDEAIHTLREARRRFPGDVDIASTLARLSPADNRRLAANR